MLSRTIVSGDKVKLRQGLVVLVVLLLRVQIVSLLCCLVKMYKTLPALHCSMDFVVVDSWIHFCYNLHPPPPPHSNALSE